MNRNIALAIVAIAEIWRITYGFSARQINEGSCLAFAHDVKRIVPEAKVIWNDEFDHAYIRYRDRLYDAERPRGVRRYTQLPCVRRQLC